MAPMRKALLILALSMSVQASWFAQDDVKDVANWNAGRLTQWLRDNGIAVPGTYGAKEMSELVAANWDAAQKAAGIKSRDPTWMNQIKSGAFQSWDESQLRHFLLEHGVVSPHSKKEELELLASQQYSSIHASATSLSSLLYGSATSVAQVASASMSSAASAASAGATDNAKWMYNAAHDAALSNAQWAKNYVTGAMDDAKDYVWSTWDDNQMRTYLEKNHLIKTKETLKREDLIARLKAHTTDPVYDMWSDSFLKSWLVRENLIKSDTQATRDQLVNLAKNYYYSTNDYVYSNWKDSDLKKWLVKHDIIKSDAQLTREQMLDYFAVHFAQANDEVIGRWSESDMRNYMIKKGLLKSDRQMKKDQMIKAIKESGNSLASDVQDYIFWSDNRLRGYLRSQGVSTPDMPKTRDELLASTAKHWEATSKRVDSVLSSIKHALAHGAHIAEDKLLQVLAVVGGSGAHILERGAELAGEAASSVSANAVRMEATASAAADKHTEL